MFQAAAQQSNAEHMDLEQKSIERSRRDFEVFRKKADFTIDDEWKLLADITDLLGWYRIDKKSQILSLAEKMIAFGEAKNWSMAGPRTLLNQAGN